jgi:hypothetical protein
VRGFGAIVGGAIHHGDRRLDGTSEIEPKAPSATPTADAAVLAELTTMERDILQERFVDFERAVLQENIVLCDHKSGVLLAFTGAMVVYCVSELGGHFAGGLRGWMGFVVPGAILIAALAFLISSSFSLSTVMPRIRRGVTEDHIFWEAPAFKLPVEEYVAVMMGLDPVREHHEKLRHLHTLAAICRSKYANLRQAMTFAIVGFAVLVVGELIKSSV